jgi:hypothetical protein
LKGKGKTAVSRIHKIVRYLWRVRWKKERFEGLNLFIWRGEKKMIEEESLTSPPLSPPERIFCFRVWKTSPGGRFEGM